MNSFVINGTEFGVDCETSRLGFDPDTNGGRSIDLIIHGDNSTYEGLTEAEESEWSWTLYPPRFYMSGLPVPSGDAFTIQLAANELENYDTAIYLMEHNFVESLTLSIAAAQVEVHGKVDLLGRMVDFAIRWSVARATT